MLEQLTYVQIGDRLNISSEGARAIVKRNRLPRSHDKNGKTLVAIDLDELQHRPLPVRSARRLPVTDVIVTLKARIEQLEAELAAEQQRSVGHRAHYEHERERADLLARSHENLDINSRTCACICKLGGRPPPPEHCAIGGVGCARPADEIFRIHHLRRNVSRVVPGYSITSSAMASSFDGTSDRVALADLASL
jgi:hypothetical protein